MTRLVRDEFNIDEDQLYLKSSESDHWYNCYTFYNQIKNEDTAGLTDKQVLWLEDIEHALSPEDDSFWVR